MQTHLPACMPHFRSYHATNPCLMERPLARGLYTTGAGQASAMLVTELGPSLAMLGRVHQELLLEPLKPLPGKQSLVKPHTQATQRINFMKQGPSTHIRPSIAWSRSADVEPPATCAADASSLGNSHFLNFKYSTIC